MFPLLQSRKVEKTTKYPFRAPAPESGPTSDDGVNDAADSPDPDGDDDDEDEEEEDSEDDEDEDKIPDIENNADKYKILDRGRHLYYLPPAERLPVRPRTTIGIRTSKGQNGRRRS
jgi:hypothetical protein